MSELTPYLAVSDARAAIDWYVAALGAEVTFEPVEMPDGRIGHVELAIGGARWMMADEHPEIAVEAPDARTEAVPSRCTCRSRTATRSPRVPGRSGRHPDGPGT